MITVGVPTYNEEEVIGTCINSILPQLSKKDELIVVASGCTDNTEEVIKKIVKKDKRVKLITEKERKGKTSALNIIKKKAKSDIIVQTDGDVMVGKNSIKELVKHFENKEIGGVSGNPIPSLPRKNPFYEWTIMSYRKMNQIRLDEHKKGIFWHMSGYLCAYRKKALPLLPMAKGAVDALMGNFIKEKGYKINYEPKAEVFVKAPLTATDFINQKARVRSGFYSLAAKYKNRPRKMKSEIIYFPKELLNVKVGRMPAFFYSAFIYLYAWLKGWYLFKKKASLKQTWKHIISTKK